MWNVKRPPPPEARIWRCSPTLVYNTYVWIPSIYLLGGCPHCRLVLRTSGLGPGWGLLFSTHRSMTAAGGGALLRSGGGSRVFLVSIRLALRLHSIRCSWRVDTLHDSLCLFGALHLSANKPFLPYYFAPFVIRLLNARCIGQVIFTTSIPRQSNT